MSLPLPESFARHQVSAGGPVTEALRESFRA
ncbi:hypothetical protein ATK36_5860 [Amycolatopsis sulphurea]|uniref:Uncharacterized protein n=1 Tax=Amycolatopsis sulphurea TaxID=76022 RepID=A0A2A9FJK9_9PSEU|nr:hypothetical protein ATK36_5860 [Amycolatopsis sulphurea]